MEETFNNVVNHLQLTARLMDIRNSTFHFDKNKTLSASQLDGYPDAYFSIQLGSTTYEAIAPIEQVIDGCYEPAQTKPELFTIVVAEGNIVSDDEMIQFIRDFREAFEEAAQYLF